METSITTLQQFIVNDKEFNWHLLKFYEIFIAVLWKLYCKYVSEVSIYTAVKLP